MWFIGGIIIGLLWFVWLAIRQEQDKIRRHNDFVNDISDDPNADRKIEEYHEREKKTYRR